MNGMRIPILKVGRVLLVPIQVDMDDRTVLLLQERVLAELERTGARVVICERSMPSCTIVCAIAGETPVKIQRAPMSLAAVTVLIK